MHACELGYHFVKLMGSVSPLAFYISTFVKLIVDGSRKRKKNKKEKILVVDG
jgi:hypothetical protein